eukprot:5093251-Amphidinium_carterae.1
MKGGFVLKPIGAQVSYCVHLCTFKSLLSWNGVVPVPGRGGGGRYLPQCDRKTLSRRSLYVCLNVSNQKIKHLGLDACIGLSQGWRSYATKKPKPLANPQLAYVLIAFPSSLADSIHIQLTIWWELKV